MKDRGSEGRATEVLFSMLQRMSNTRTHTHTHTHTEETTREKQKQEIKPHLPILEKSAFNCASSELY